MGFELLRRSLEALDPADFLKSNPDLWLYFYEDFLAAYDPKLRKKYGVYYTPREVVELQVRLASELLEDRFDKKLGFADDGVVFLDPAVGTGTYPVAAVKHGLEKVRARFGKDPVAGGRYGAKAPTMQNIVERFLKEYVPTHCKSGTREVYRSALEIHVVPRLGNRRVADIERTDIASLHHELRATP